jgi:hypothetical protein
VTSSTAAAGIVLRRFGRIAEVIPPFGLAGAGPDMAGGGSVGASDERLRSSSSSSISDGPGRRLDLGETFDVDSGLGRALRGDMERAGVSEA